MRQEVSWHLGAIGAKMDTAEVVYDPWTEVKDARQQFGVARREISQQVNREEMSMSLEELLQKLSKLNNTLLTVESSWAPWDDITDAKEHLRHLQSIVDRERSDDREVARRLRLVCETLC